MKNSIITFSFLLLAFGCEKITYSIDNPFSGLQTRVLMHRGSGDNPDLVGNTLEAAEYGLSKLDGIELDIQFSKDGTLWLDHNNQVHDCNGKVMGCFQEMTDAEIAAAAECDGVVRYHPLESVFQLLTSKYPESYISLDIKGQYCQILVIPSVMKRMAESVLALVTKYQIKNKVLVESSSLGFMSELDNQKLVGQCVVSLGDVDKGIADARVTKARGISYKYGVEPLTAADVALVHKKGYGFVIWTVNEPDDIITAWATRPDFIQTDNPKFKNYVNAPR